MAHACSHTHKRGLACARSARADPAAQLLSSNAAAVRQVPRLMMASAPCHIVPCCDHACSTSPVLPHYHLLHPNTTICSQLSTRAPARILPQRHYGTMLTLQLLCKPLVYKSKYIKAQDSFRAACPKNRGRPGSSRHQMPPPRHSLCRKAWPKLAEVAQNEFRPHTRFKCSTAQCPRSSGMSRAERLIATQAWRLVPNWFDRCSGVEAGPKLLRPGSRAQTGRSSRPAAPCGAPPA